MCIIALKKSYRFLGGNAEIIVVDNESTDGTVEIAKREGCRVASLKGGTIAMIRNYGAINSKGRILAFLDADCIVPPEWISYCLQRFEGEGIGIVGN